MKSSSITSILGLLALCSGLFGCSPPKQQTTTQQNALCASDSTPQSADMDTTDSPDAACPSLCEAGRTRCGDSCADTSSDTMNCGICGNTCGESFECQAGVCACPQGETECGGTCLDLETDDENCGACGNACPEKIGCMQGECKCPDDGKVCDGVCTQVEDNEEHCGTCGNTCKIGCKADTCVEITSLAAYESHTCVTLSDGDVYCWGYNNFGQLGRGMWGMIESAPVKATVLDAYHAKQVVVGYLYTCILDDKNKVYCIGSDSQGPRLLESNHVAPKEITGFSDEVVSISGGRAHACALLKNGKAACWGFDGNGRLGDGASTNTIKGPVDVAGLDGLATIEAGDSQTCAIVKEGGKLYCWGQNQSTNLGLASTQDVLSPTDNLLSTTESFIQVSASTFNTCAVNTDGQVFCAGENSSGEAGQPDGSALIHPLQKVGSTYTGSFTKKVQTGINHSCVLFRGKSVACWGKTNFLQTGGGFHRDVEKRVKIVVGQRNIELLAGGSSHTCAASKQVLHCWGRNDLGQLGLGYEEIAHGPQPVDLRKAWSKENP